MKDSPCSLSYPSSLNKTLRSSLHLSSSSASWTRCAANGAKAARMTAGGSKAARVAAGVEARGRAWGADILWMSVLYGLYTESITEARDTADNLRLRDRNG
eukprot:11734227-Heterocapsa_arctica.AAC.2